MSQQLLGAYDKANVSPLCYNWNSASSSTSTFSLKRLVHIFTGYVLGTINQFESYVFLLSLTQRLMSSMQNQNSWFTLWWNGSLCIGARVPCLIIPTLALHKIPILACTTQYLFVRVEWQVYNVPGWDTRLTIRMTYGNHVWQGIIVWGALSCS